MNVKKKKKQGAFKIKRDFSCVRVGRHLIADFFT